MSRSAENQVSAGLSSCSQCVPTCAGVESSLRVSRCRQIVESLPEHNLTVLKFLMEFLNMVGLRI